MKFITRIILIVFISSILSACTTKDREQTFQSTLRKYERVMRWGDLSKLNIFRKTPVTISAATKEKFKNIKVTGYNELSVVPESALTYIVTVNIKYYNQLNMREKEIDDRQVWNFDEARELWFISSPLPKF